MEKTVLNSMFDNLLHIGNKTNFWNAKMRPYIYGAVNGIHVINLVKTQEKLDEMVEELKKYTSAGKTVLVVATKIQSRDAFENLAKETGSLYVCEQWVPGLLTNYSTIKRRIRDYLKLMKDVETGALDILTKKEKAGKLLELEKLEKSYSGLKEMKKLPDVILVSDGIHEQHALKEARKLGLPSFAIFNTNGDIDIVDHFVPANTNSPRSFDYLAKELKAGFVAAAQAPKAKIPIKKMEPKAVSGEKKTPVAKKATTKEA